MNDLPQEPTPKLKTSRMQQGERVSFLYERFAFSMWITLFTALVVSSLAYYELDLQTRQHWVFGWIAGLVSIQLARYRLKLAYQRQPDNRALNYRLWKRRFALGVFAVAAWQGFGVVLAMPYISDNLRLILNIFLLGLSAGAMAYLATSVSIYCGYLVLMMMPITLFLLVEGSTGGIVLGLFHLFAQYAYYRGVKHLNLMIVEALSLRFENEILVSDLQRLLGAVAKSNKELDLLATTDEMTGAANFRAFRVGLENQCRKNAEGAMPLTLAMINIDYFYEYNLYYGQDIGNRTITRVAHLLMAEVINSNEMVARINGAEFAVLLPGISCHGARLLMESVRDKVVNQRIEHARSNINNILTLSIGICCAPISAVNSSRELIMKAEFALRQAKKKGRDRIEIVDN